MRRPAVIALSAVAVILAIVAVVFIGKYQKTSQDLAVTTSAKEQAEGSYEKTIEAISEIQDSLNAISLGDTNVARMPWNAETGQKMSKADEQQALERIGLLRQSLARNHERIVQLESSLKKSGNKVAGLNKMVAQLKHDLGEKEQAVADLQAHVDQLQGQVTTLTTTVQQRDDTLAVRDQTLESKRSELATIFYVVGDKSALKQAGVIESKGGLLGLGKTITPATIVNPSAFSTLDTDQEKVIRTQSTKARVITPQPATSYEWVNEGGYMELHIIDPVEFRKIRQLVILTG